MSATPSSPAGPLAGRHALVTGAGRGIGRACALALAADGARVTLVARSGDELEQLAGEIAAAGGVAHTAAADVTDGAAIEQVVAAAEAVAPLSLCLNAAGINRPGPTTEMTAADWQMVVDVNLNGTFHVCRAFGAVLLAAERQGRIVNVSSQMGSVGYPGRAAYCASKHAVNGLTKALAVEWAPQGIAVNAIAPTFVRTPMTEPMLADPAFREEVVRRIPMGRIGTMDEVVAATSFLLSDAASLITGEVLAVDGGWTAW